MTTGQVDEVQAVYCQCASCTGFVTLTFEGDRSAPIAYNAVALTSDESTAIELGTGVGESVQSKLEVGATPLAFVSLSLSLSLLSLSVPVCA